MENNEGNTGVEKELTPREKTIGGTPLSISGEAHLTQQNAALIAALKELIPIAERILAYYPNSSPIVEYFKSAIENAKRLIP